MSDPVDDLRQALAGLQQKAIKLGAEVAKFEAATAALETSVHGAGGATWMLYDRLRVLGDLAVQYIADFEFAVTEARLGAKLPSAHYDPITYETDLFSVVLTPDSSVAIGWYNRPGPLPKPGSIILDIPIQARINRIDQEPFLIRVEVILSLDVKAGKMTMTPSSAPRLLNFDGTPSLVLQRVPREYGVREQVTERLDSGVNSLLSSLQWSITHPPGGPFSVSEIHSYRITNDFISFAARSLPMRRTKEPLLSKIRPGFSEALRAVKALVSQKIAAQIATMDAQLIALDLGWSSFSLSVFKHYDETKCLIVDVKVDVFPVYVVTLYSSAPGRLQAFAEMTIQPPFCRVDIDHCWPFCGDVEDQVRDRINAEWPKFRTLSFQFADLSGYAASISGETDPHGVTLMVEPAR